MGAGAGLLAMTQAAGAGKDRSQRRNVLLYIADDQGMDDAGCYGNKIVRTPGQDALAREGVRFTQAFCTTPSCSPSRSVLLSGLHNHATGQYGLAHRYHHFVSFPDVRSLPALLRDAGYRTVCAGKYHLEPEPAYHFDEYIKGEAPSLMAEQCEAVIGDPGERPFFLYFCPTEPHRPFHREGSAPIDPKDVIVPPYLPDIPECREELAEYYGSIERCDSGLLRLIEILKKTGRWEDTLIVYVSDNGAPFPGAKTNLYDPGIRLPCIIRNPFEKRQGHTCDAMVSWTDIAPSILDYAGALTDPASFHGRSVLSVVREKRVEGWDEVYCSHTFHEVTMYYPMRAVRTRRHKLIWNAAHPLEFPSARDLWDSKTWQAVLERGIKTYGKRTVAAYHQRPKFELYDLENDPDEIQNLADDPECKDVFDGLLKRLKGFQERTQDPWILKWEHE
ncbi:MAG: sulfatase [Candidatus Hydrogenedentes bacterium]|nr:sulfatase [Candidatus Hydrogenedentota bacterium]